MKQFDGTEASGDTVVSQSVSQSVVSVSSVSDSVPPPRFLLGLRCHSAAGHSCSAEPLASRASRSHG